VTEDTAAPTAVHVKLWTPGIRTVGDRDGDGEDPGVQGGTGDRPVEGEMDRPVGRPVADQVSEATLEESVADSVTG